MKTNNQKSDNLKTKNMNNTTIISIPACASSTVLKSLHTNNVNCKYVGIDQSGRILMELTYEKKQFDLIKEIVSYMEKAEEMVNEFTKIVNETISKMQEQEDKAWEKKVKDLKIRFEKRKHKKDEHPGQEATVN